MAGKEKEGSSNALPGALLAIAVSLVGVAFWQTPLKSSRPSTDEKPVGRNNESLPARLWQNPFQVVHDYRDTSEASNKARPADSPGADSKHHLAAFRNEIDERREHQRHQADKGEDANGVLVLPVMVEDTPYAESAETALRSRYAVLSALGRAGYIPDDGQHIGFVTVPWLPDSEIGRAKPVAALNACEAKAWPRLDIPYEWLRHNSRTPAGVHPPHEVLVLWLNDDQFTRYPLTRLAQLSQALNVDRSSLPSCDRFAAPSRGDNWKPGEMAMKVLGPASSTTLNGLVQDPILSRWAAPPQFYSPKYFPQVLKALNPFTKKVPAEYQKVVRAGEIDRSLQGVEIYSFRATVPPYYLDLSGPSTWAEQRTWTLPAQCPANSLVQVHRTSGSDEYLVDSLITELERRGVDLTGGKDSIALIGEWDTLYGRSMPLTFHAVLQNRVHNAQSRVPQSLAQTIGDLYAPGGSIAATPQINMQGIQTYSYLRGIDGQTHGNTGSQKSPNSPGKKTDSEQKFEAEDQERADGVAQYDYLRRIATQLEVGEARASSEHRPLRAIGVIGSDVYDKLLVLRALHGRFPEAILFTTDLDNRLFARSERTWTRGIIVASHFGLTLRDNLQGNDQGIVPPFRDGYQTALFESCLAAIGYVGEGEWKTANPRLFEIGRDQPVDLSIEDPPSFLTSADRPSETSKEAPSVHPPRRHPPALAQILRGWSSVLLILLAVLVLICGGLYWTREKKVLPSIALGFLTISLIAFFVTVVDEPDASSPLASVWMRLFHTFLAVVVVATVAFLLVAANHSLWKVARSRAARRRALSQSESAHPSAEQSLASRQQQSLFLLFAVFLVFMAVLVACILYGYDEGRGVPLIVNQGISLWPSEVIRVAAIFLAIAFLINARFELRRSNLLLSEKFALRVSEVRQDLIGTWFPKLRVWRSAMARWFRKFLLTPPIEAKNTKDSLCPNTFPRSECWTFVGFWEQREPPGLVDDLWHENLTWANGENRAARVLLLTLIYGLAAFLLYQFLGWPHAPFRGQWSHHIDSAAMILSTVTLYLLTFYVVDATRLCEAFSKKLAGDRTPWSDQTLDQFSNIRKVDRGLLGDWLDIQFIAERTEVVGQMIFYPFFILAILIVARLDLFAHWSWPLSSWVVSIVILLYAALCGLTLRRTAEAARTRALANLNRQLVAMYTDPGNKEKIEQIKLLMAEIESNTQGAFAPLSQHPLIRAILIPLSSAGILTLLNYLPPM